MLKISKNKKKKPGPLTKSHKFTKRGNILPMHR